jgi:hypothetical protein
MSCDVVPVCWRRDAQRSMYGDAASSIQRCLVVELSFSLCMGPAIWAHAYVQTHVHAANCHQPYARGAVKQKKTQSLWQPALANQQLVRST